MISAEEVKKIAKLARIELTEREVEAMQKDLSSILDYFELLKKADVSGVSSDFSLNDLKNEIRNDEVVVDSEREKIIEQAPEKEGNFVKVKEILK